MSSRRPSGGSSLRAAREPGRPRPRGPGTGAGSRAGEVRRAAGPIRPCRGRAGRVARRAHRRAPRLHRQCDRDPTGFSRPGRGRGRAHGAAGRPRAPSGRSPLPAQARRDSRGPPRAVCARQAGAATARGGGNRREPAPQPLRRSGVPPLRGGARAGRARGVERPGAGTRRRGARGRAGCRWRHCGRPGERPRSDLSRRQPRALREGGAGRLSSHRVPARRASQRRELPQAQPPHKRTRALHAGSRGARSLGRPDHRGLRARAGARGSRRAGSHHEPALGGLQSPAALRSQAGAGTR